MSNDFTEIKSVEWENVARRIFYECLASSSSSSSISTFSSLSSTTSKVTVKTLVDYIRNNASGNCRNKYLLDELQKSIEEVSWDGQVNYTLFKKASRRWIDKIQHHYFEDGNNNVSEDDSRSEDEKQNSGESSDNDRDFGILGERSKKTKTPRKFVTADFVDLLNVSSYSPSSEATHGCVMSDITPESADDTDSGCGVAVGIGEVSQLDLRLRVRRFDEENALLREDLVRAEELTGGLQRQLENLRQKLDRTKEKCRQLERENDEYQELLHEAEQKERDCRWALQKAEKDRGLIARKLEDAETEIQQVSLLNSKLEICKKEKYDCMKEATMCQRELDEKHRECELLKEKIAEINEVNQNFQESYDKTIQRLREKVQELKEEKFILQTPSSIGSPSDGICSTPRVECLQSYMRCTPYSNHRLHDSLYDELRASGFSAANESRVRELENELSWYEEEIHQAVGQINNITEQLCDKRSTPQVPDLKLNNSGDEKASEMSLLLRKISELSNMVNEIIWRPKVKDASSQLCADSDRTNELLSSQFGIRSFQDHLCFLRKRTESETERPENSNFERDRDFFLEAFSMNSRLLGEYVEEVEIASEAAGYPDTDNSSISCKGSMPKSRGIQENTIIDPIVQELDRILQCTNKHEEEANVNSSSLKNPRYRCIYTAVDNYATDSSLNSPKLLPRDLASTYVLSSGGDGLSLGMINDTAKNGVDTAEPTDSVVKSFFSENSDTFDADSVTESMLKSRNLKTTKFVDSETIPEEFIDSELLDKKSNLQIYDNLSSAASSSRTPDLTGKISENLVTKKIDLPNGETTSYCATPNASLRNFPKRKISVFHRSFDVDTLHGGGETGGSNTYRLTERSMSIPSEQETIFDDGMELDPECMKMSLNTRKFLLNYRDKTDDSDSSDSLSPLTSMDLRDQASLTEAVSSLPSTKKRIILAPTKLKLPSLKEIPPYCAIQKNSTINNGSEDKPKPDACLDKPGDALDIRELPINETRETCESSNSKEDKISTPNEASCLVKTEMTRSTDKIERGVTCRKKSFPRELNFSDYSLLSPMNDTSVENQASIENSVSKIVVPTDGESKSRGTSPKREPPVAQATLKLPLLPIHQKPQVANRTSASQDPSESRGSSWNDRAEEEAGSGYQTRNESATGVGSYGGVITGTDIRDDGKDENANASAVALAMSSGEESSDSECDPMAIRDDADRRNVVNETRSISPTVLKFVDGALLGTSTPAPTNIGSKKSDGIQDCETKKLMAQKRDKRERPHTIRRSLSESGCGRSECRCRLTNVNSSQEEFNKEESRTTAFPSLTDARLQESGIANLSSTDELGRSLPEADLERKYIAFSIGLVTDRVTLQRRVALSIRQRDQSERNLSCEVQKMHQAIQDLAPLCIDRESVERVERVRHQLEMIAQCAHRVACTAETLGAVHEENRISRAILLADRYLLVLRSRCEKLALDLSETKRILMENNIVMEENNGELGDDMPRTRYRGVPITNRTMMARRRASIATIFRPLGNLQDVTKDGLRQRNSVSGRVTLRRPSLTVESQKWEAEKLDRTDSSSSIGELREIFEQAESRRNSREENNNNVLRLHSSNLSVRDCENSGELDVWTNAREDPVPELSVNVDGCHESRLGRRTPLPPWLTTHHAPWKTMLWCIIISFFFGFYVNHVVSSVNECSGTHFKWWSIEEILGRYLPVKNDPPRPI